MLVWIDVMIAALMLLAGPYRVFAYKFRAFGGVGLGLVTWIGIAVVFPAFCIYSDADATWLLVWGTLGVWAYIKTMVQWISTKPRRDLALPHSWSGSLEPVCAVAVVMVTGSAGGLFFLVGYACSVAEWRLQRLKMKVSVWTKADTERLLGPVRKAAARARQVVAAGAPVATRYGATIGHATITASRYASERWRRRQQPPLSPGHHRPLTFWGWVARYVVGRTVFALLIGSPVIWWLIKHIWTVLLICAAMMIRGGGGEANLPDYAEEDSRSIATRMKDWLGGQKDKAVGRFRDNREELEERWSRNKYQLKDGVKREVRETIRESIFGQ